MKFNFKSKPKRYEQGTCPINSFSFGILAKQNRNSLVTDFYLFFYPQYLARNFQALPGHTYLEEGSVQTLPLIPANLIMGLRVLIPGQTIPLNYSNPEIVNAIRESLDENHNMFGFLQKK
jgi:hypothetical protein